MQLIHEPFDPQQRAQRVFVDPVLFAFWAVNAEGADILCLLVQFKTVVSRDPDHVELQSLYCGTRVYKFTAQPGDVSLITLICSDAFEFTNELVDAHCMNLLLHIQLNQRPVTLTMLRIVPECFRWPATTMSRSFDLIGQKGY